MTTDAADGRFHISVVCTGNICRSPMAAIMLRAAIDDAGLGDRVRVTSAGTGPWHAGGPAHELTQRVLADNGYLTEHVAHQITAAELSTADLVLAADRGHVAALRRMNRRASRSTDRIVLFRSFDPDAGEQDLPDPWGGPQGEFVAVFEMVRAALPGIIAEVRRQVG